MAGKHDAEQIKADAKHAAAGVCPECSQGLEDVDLLAHIVGHWPNYQSLKTDSDAARRVRLLLKYGQDQ